MDTHDFRSEATNWDGSARDTGPGPATLERDQAIAAARRFLADQGAAPDIKLVSRQLLRALAVPER